MLASNFPREQVSLSLGQNTMQTMESGPSPSPSKCTFFSRILLSKFFSLIFMAEKLSKWVEMYDWNDLNNSLKASFKYDGFSQSGFHLFTLTPRPLLEMKNTQNRSLHFLPKWKSYMILDHLLRYIPSVISRTVQDDRFALVIQDIYSMSGCSKLCFQLVKSVCKSLQERTCLGFFRIFYIVVVDGKTSEEFAKATGFQKRFFPADDNETWSKYVEELFDFLRKPC